MKEAHCTAHLKSFGGGRQSSWGLVWKQRRNSNKGKRCNASESSAHHHYHHHPMNPPPVLQTSTAPQNTMYSTLRRMRQCCNECKSIRPKIKRLQTTTDTHMRDAKRKSAQQGYDCAWGIDAGLRHYEVHMQKLINNKCADSERNKIHRRVTVREWSCE